MHASVEKSHQLTQVDKWVTPEHGWLKANADGAVSKHKDRGGGGVVLRDHDGAFRGGGATCVFPGVADPEVAEALACRKAVQLAVQVGATRVHVETDNKGIAAMLNGKLKNLSAVGPIIEDTKRMLLSFADFKASWVRRSGNRGAHSLAREGVALELNRFWFNEPSECILQVVSDEIPSMG